MAGLVCTGGRGLRQALSPQTTRNLIRSGSKRAEALETLTAQVAELQNTLQVFLPSTQWTDCLLHYTARHAAF